MSQPFDPVAVANSYLQHARLNSARARKFRIQIRAGSIHQFEPYLAARAARSNWVEAARLLLKASGCGNSTHRSNDRCVSRILAAARRVA